MHILVWQATPAIQCARRVFHSYLNETKNLKYIHIRTVNCKKSDQTIFNIGVPCVLSKSTTDKSRRQKSTRHGNRASESSCIVSHIWRYPVQSTKRLTKGMVTGRDQDGPLLRFYSQSASAVWDYILSSKSVWKIVQLPVFLDPFNLRLGHK